MSYFNGQKNIVLIFSERGSLWKLYAYENVLLLRKQGFFLYRKRHILITQKFYYKNLGTSISDLCQNKIRKYLNISVLDLLIQILNLVHSCIKGKIKSSFRIPIFTLNISMRNLFAYSNTLLIYNREQFSLTHCINANINMKLLLHKFYFVELEKHFVSLKL